MWHGIGQQQSALKGAKRAEAADIQQKLYFILQTTMPMLANRGHLFTNRGHLFTSVLETD